MLPLSTEEQPPLDRTLPPLFSGTGEEDRARVSMP
jgi:hypothetical protein